MDCLADCLLWLNFLAVPADLDRLALVPGVEEVLHLLEAQLCLTDPVDLSTKVFPSLIHNLHN